MQTETLTPTMRKFGAPESIVSSYQHWYVLLRPWQVTLGSLIVIAREAVTAWPQLSAGAFTELHQVTADLENTLQQAFGYEKINYLMLMMVDPDVHFHVIPRYSGTRIFADCEFIDAGWPGPPRLDSVNAADQGAILAQLHDTLTRHWPQ